MLAVASPAQTLARPGWAGSGLNADPWWAHAVFYRIQSAPAGETDYKEIAERLETLQSLGVDALLVPTPKLPSRTEVPAQRSSVQSPASADMPDGFDDLIRQASVHGIRVLLDIGGDASGADLAATARFWLSHGVAGFHVIGIKGAVAQTQTTVQVLRKATNAAVGQRIVLSDLDLGAAAAMPQDATSTPSRSSHSSSRSRLAYTPADRAQLQIQTLVDAAGIPPPQALREKLMQTLGQPNVMLDLHSPAAEAAPDDASRPLAKVMAAIALTMYPAAVIEAGDEQGATDAATASTPMPPSQPSEPKSPQQPAAATAESAGSPLAKEFRAGSLAEWYRQLGGLHHGNPALRYGMVTLLNFDAQNALVWVARPAVPSALTPPVFVACNLSGKPVQLSLAEAVKSMNLHGFFLRTLLRTDDAMGAQDLNAVTLPPYGVYIGELKR